MSPERQHAPTLYVAAPGPGCGGPVGPGVLKTRRPSRGCWTLKGHNCLFLPPPPCAPPLLRRTRGTVDGPKDTFAREGSQDLVTLGKPAQPPPHCTIAEISNVEYRMTNVEPPERGDAIKDANTSPLIQRRRGGRNFRPPFAFVVGRVRECDCLG